MNILMRDRRFVRVALVGVVALVSVSCGVRQERTPDQFPTDETVTTNRNAIGVPYGRWILLAEGDRRIALRIDAEDATGRHIAYRWRSTTADAPGFLDAAATAAEGRTREIDGMGRIVIGTLQLDWSLATTSSGWLYWPPGDRDLRAWAIPFAELDHVPPDPRGDWWLTEP